MIAGLLVISFTAFLIPAAESSAKYVLNSSDTRRIEGVLTYEITMPKLFAQEWIICAAKAPELPGQIRVNTTLEPNGKSAFELSPERRPIMMARVSAQDGRAQHIMIHVKYQAILRSRELAPWKEGKSAPAVTALSEKTRETALTLGGDFDWKAEAVQKWVREHQLERNKGESDVDFARRVFVAIKRNFKYEYKTEMNRHASAVCKAGKSDCGGLSQLFVTVLRGNDIPARTLVGRWAQSSKPEEMVGGLAYYETHVKAEFFAAGVGWVPADVATGMQDKNGDGLRCFGHDPGDFLTMHVDPHLRLDTIHFGKEDVGCLQGPAYWVKGRGSVEPTQTHEKWEVRDIQK